MYGRTLNLLYAQWVPVLALLKSSNQEQLMMSQRFMLVSWRTSGSILSRENTPFFSSSRSTPRAVRWSAGTDRLLM